MRLRLRSQAGQTRRKGASLCGGKPSRRSGNAAGASLAPPSIFDAPGLGASATRIDKAQWSANPNSLGRQDQPAHFTHGPWNHSWSA